MAAARVASELSLRPRLPAHIHACLFDLDGVLTRTAELHEAAWKTTFEAFLRERQTTPFVPFSAADYTDYVDGRAREDGVRSFLASRGIDADGNEVRAVANRKNELLLELVRTKGVAVYDGSVRFVRAARDAGLGTAVVSASANCADVLKVTHLDELFDVRVDGEVARRRCLRGKPAPDMFLAAAAELEVAPERAAVLEDALVGVAAGRAGGFGIVVGVDHGAQAGALLANGADVVVTDLAELLEPA